MYAAHLNGELTGISLLFWCEFFAPKFQRNTQLSVRKDKYTR
jgi:hypothetical protein